jgi:WD40 repeat protein
MSRVDTQALGLAQVRDPKRYLILGEHGRGGLGRVSRAHDRELGRDVAIKELISRGSVSEVRFLREALITARLEHPGIVAVHEAGCWPDGTPFYAMKLVSGRSLRQLFAERPTAGERLGLLHHVIAVADAIAYAHGRHIVHRDLKPANVIVGDFGETVVIDWGLAKDLHATEEADLGSGPVRFNRDSELTGAGMVLGTPAYMPPEQARGEHVDQRADVFAIGVMLWELCALRRVPPGAVHHRRRMLRRAGIDRDLAAIITKALDPDPARRYPDAGALATDLKAFKSGARIAARHYTLVAMLAHWVRRHRALALSVTAAIALALAGVAVFVRNIAIERDRADAALARANASNSDRTLEHAKLLLQSDPTAAVAALTDYHGSDEVRRRRMIAEARGRGVASAVHMPHSDTIWFLHGDRSGAIVSLSEDRRIQLTVGSSSTTLANDVSSSVRIAYVPSRQLLAYATSPAGIAVLDLATRRITPITGFDPIAMAIAPDGSRLAAIDGRGELQVWSVVAPAALTYRAVFPDAIDLKFATPTRLIVQARAMIRAVALDPTGGEPDARTISDVSALDARPDAVVAGIGDGSVVMLSRSLAVLGRAPVCRRQVATVRFISGTDRLAVSCPDDLLAIVRYDAARSALAIVDTFATRGLTEVQLDTTGRHVAAVDESNTAYLYDTRTRLLTRYDGNAGKPSFAAVPTPEFPHVLIGDVNGAVRVWDPPSDAARVILQAPSAIYGLAFTPDGRTVVTDGADGIVRRIEVGGGAASELHGHSALVAATRVAPDGSSFLSYSYDGTVRVWRAADSTPSRRFAEHAGMVADVEYVEHGRRIVSVSEDGRLLAWSPDGTDVAELFKHTSPLAGVEVLHDDHVVINDVEGSLWDISLRGEIKKVRDPDGATITTLRASDDGSYVAIGTETGVVAIYETSRWRLVKRISVEGSIHRLAFDPLNRDLLVASEAGHAQFGHVRFVALGGRRTAAWQDVIAEARGITYAPDGETIGFVCKDGGTWLYSLRGDLWAYARDHDAEATGGRFSPDGKLFVTTDRRGVVVVRDVAATLAAAGHPGSQ